MQRRGQVQIRAAGDYGNIGACTGYKLAQPATAVTDPSPLAPDPCRYVACCAESVPSPKKFKPWLLPEDEALELFGTDVGREFGVAVWSID